MANWPATLKVNRNGFKESPADNIIRSGMDAGPDKVRRRSTAGVRPVSFMLFLTDDQLDTLEDFYVNQLYSGSLSFLFVNPRTNLTVTARFTEAPEFSQDETKWRVPISLEILP